MRSEYCALFRYLFALPSILSLFPCRPQRERERSSPREGTRETEGGGGGGGRTADTPLEKGKGRGTNHRWSRITGFGVRIFAVFFGQEICGEHAREKSPLEVRFQFIKHDIVRRFAAIHHCTHIDCAFLLPLPIHCQSGPPRQTPPLLLRRVHYVWDRRGGAGHHRIVCT